MRSFKRVLALTVMSAMLFIPAFSFAESRKENAKPISFKDHLGRQIELDAVPKRVASVATPGGSMVVTIVNDGETLVATTPKSNSGLRNGVLTEFFPGLNNVVSNIVSNNNTPNIEELLYLKPDVVIQWARKTKSIEAMEVAGLTVVALKYAKTDIAKTWLSTLGIMMDKSDKANDILQWHQSAYERIISKTGSIGENKKPKVLYMMSPERAAGPLSHVQFFIDTAGAQNALVSKEKFIYIDPEMLLKANPDIIWIAGYNMKFFPETIYNNPIFSEVNAVKNRRIYKVPVGGGRWDPPNQELPLACEWYTRTVHPDLLDGSIRDSIKKAYQVLYGKIPSKEQLDKILRVKINSGADAYEVISR